MILNAVNLSWAIINWLEYEFLCQRENLLSEASLKTPIAEFLNATQDQLLVTEQPYPPKMQSARGRRRSADFCLQRRTENQTWTTILESKWVNGRRDLNQEIFDDLLRLECVRKTDQSEAFDRYFLLAGYDRPIKELFISTANTGSGGARVSLYETVLPLHGSLNVPVLGAPVGVIEYWIAAAESIGLKELPLSMTIELAAAITFDDRPFQCWVWRVSSVPNRQVRPISW